MSVDQASLISYLVRARHYGVKLGLETILELCTHLGSPERYLRFIHIAGTNGKGSTSAFMESILRQAGGRVGLFTSPHLCSLRERIQIDRVNISHDQLLGILQRVKSIAERAQLTPTFFELITVCALCYFQEEKVDWVVWETGLGGRLDSTNIVLPWVTIITSIGFDHRKQLGNTLSEIAREKAGIIKKNVPVFTAVSQPEALTVITEVARAQSAPLFQVREHLSLAPSTINSEGTWLQMNTASYRLGLNGVHQIANAGCVALACQYLKKWEANLTEEVLRKGFSQTTWPGRFEVLRQSPPLVVDGAHNLEAIETLLATWRAMYGELPYHLIFGALSDKPYEGMAAQLAPQAQQITLVPIASERALRPQDLIASFPLKKVHCADNLESVWHSLQHAPHPVLITGSLYLIGQILHFHHPQQFPRDEWNWSEKM